VCEQSEYPCHVRIANDVRVSFCRFAGFDHC
jgi:hypothetical protein